MFYNKFIIILYMFRQKEKKHKILFYNKFIIFLYMFRQKEKKHKILFYNMFIIFLYMFRQKGKKNTKSCFIISLLYSSTCFEHHVLIIRRSKLYYTASGITTHCRWPSRAQVQPEGAGYGGDPQGRCSERQPERSLNNT